ncbi:MAG: putative baseplate assembly protein [Chitinophagaceae bacterium]|nr:putative baseplate assembly protein [Chitinophagaceae bacterium]MCW5926529.1 putative baseplate assembly protein [Chitinophagaceae bacterium]
MSEVSTCNCCEGISPETPAEIYNRPGLHAIAYRAGVYHTFRRSLLSRFSSSELEALQSLTTRNEDDFTISLLDAWAVVSDVFTFYQERIANEAYLRTATERLSVLQMARLIGYELNPGVAASTYLAFTVDDTSAVPLPVPGMAKPADPFIPSLVLDAGIKVQSVPAQDEKAQTFETIEKIAARPEWNAIRPRLYLPQPVKTQPGFFIIRDITNDLKKGDVLLLRMQNKFELKQVLSVEIDTDNKITTVQTGKKVSPADFSDIPPAPNAGISLMSGQETLDDPAITVIADRTWKEEDLDTLLEKKKWPVGDLAKGIRKKIEQNNTGSDAIFIFRKTASPFGYNALKQITYNDRGIPDPVSQWLEWDLNEGCTNIYLDSEYKEVAPDSYIGVKTHQSDLDSAKVFTVEKVNIGSRSEYGLNVKSTLLQVSSGEHSCWYEGAGKGDKLSLIRGINIFMQSEELPLAELSIEAIVQNDFITLDRWYPGLKKGQMVILTGERHDLQGVVASEAMELKEVFVHKGYSVVRFTANLAYKYIRNTVTINANVALATHGETVSEVLGSGDAAVAFQQFILRQPPLTYISSSKPSGTDTTLKIYVNDILWQEVDTLFGRQPEERIYTTRINDDGKTTVIFGDGITGCRLPTGTENIRAVYRKGIGNGGLVKANQLSQLLTRPLGLKAAVNPLPSKGAADPENLEEARDNAPLTLLTFDRVVSLQDYEDFARAFAGIEKSLATWTRKKQGQCILLTIAGTNGAIVSEKDFLYKNLLKAIHESGNKRVDVELKSYRPAFFRMAAGIQIDPDYLPEKVLPQIEQALRADFSFRRRSFGQPVSLSEVITTCQGIEGVLAVDVDKLYYSDSEEGLFPILKAALPVAGNETILAAELLTLDPGPIDLKIIS